MEDLNDIYFFASVVLVRVSCAASLYLDIKMLHDKIYLMIRSGRDPAWNTRLHPKSIEASKGERDVGSKSPL